MEPSAKPVRANALPFLARREWAGHENYPAHVLLINSHANFRRISTHLVKASWSGWVAVGSAGLRKASPCCALCLRGSWVRVGCGGPLLEALWAVADYLGVGESLDLCFAKAQFRQDLAVVLA